MTTIPKVQRRDEQFAKKISTKISKEIPSPENPYITNHCFLYGYDLMDLIKKRSFVDMVFLLLRGNLPTKFQQELLETLMVGLAHPGVRHPATRAAMNAGVGKTNTAHILPISLSIMGGEYLGGKEVEAAMRFIRSSYRKDPVKIAKELLENYMDNPEENKHIAPGFGKRFGSAEIIPQEIANILSEKNGIGKAFSWCFDFVKELQKHNHSWLMTGIAAAIFVDLGFHPRAGAGLFQMFSAPGLLAQGLELSNKPMTAMPFIDNEDYICE